MLGVETAAFLGAVFSDKLSGFFLAALAAVGNGSYTVPSKLQEVRRTGVTPIAFNFWAW